MKRCLLFIFLPALFAAAPSPLVVGSVRDQFGAPIAGARVSAGAATTSTDSQGTFALSVADAKSIAISCDYCEPLNLAVVDGQPVVALVHRYSALVQEAPTDRDVASVPYARAESIISLRPFTVLENTSRPLPGAQLSDRGASSRGALLLDNGIPIYDITSNQSPFVVFPDYALQSVSWLPPSDAFSYGDLAGGGTVITQTHDQERWSGVIAGGNSNAVRAGETLDDEAWSAAASRDPNDRRQRADGFFRFPFGDDAITLSAQASGDSYRPGSQQIDTTEGGVRLAFESLRQNRVSASVVANGGYYDGAAPSVNYSAKWSDVQAQAGVATTTRIAFFTDAGVRASSGDYTSSGAIATTAGLITQTRVSAGAQTSGEGYSARLGVGGFDFAYSGGSAGARKTLVAGMLAPGFSGSYAFDPHWTLEMQAGESFALPTVLEEFVYPVETPAIDFDRNSALIGTLAYGDLRRFRAQVTTLSERVSGLDEGTIHSTGLSASWQIAPAISLRAWLMHVNDTTQPIEPVYRFGARPQPSTVGSYWLTYESSGLRIDAIYRRDLLDYRPDPHLDASISAPLAGAFRIFAQTERRAGARGVTIGVRAESP